MKIDGRRWSDISSFVLLLCALLTTVLVLRREFLQNAESAGTNNATSYEPRYIERDGWRNALAGGIRVGPAAAPVQVVEFADFECPYCADFEATVQTIRDKYPDQIAFTFVHYPLPQHPFAESAARAAECAHLQGHFDAMRSLLFNRQREFGSRAWTDFAKEVGVPDLEEFDACVNDVRSADRVAQGTKLGEEMGIRATPTIVVNGWRLPLPPTSEQFEEIIRNVLAAKPPADGVAFL